MPEKQQPSFGLAALWKEISMVAKLILFGLMLISGIVISAFFSLVMQPGPVQAGEDLYVHIALVILIPMATLSMMGLIFGYAYYQLCKRHKVQPIWEVWFR